MIRVSDDSATLLCNLYRQLREHFGYAHVWWPGTPTQVFVTSILVQQSDWSGAWKAAGKLTESGLLDLPLLKRTDPEVVCGLLHRVAFAPTKARRLVRIADILTHDGFQTVEDFLASTTNTSGEALSWR